MNLEEYYQGNHEYEFFINSWNLFTKSNIVDFLDEFDYAIGDDEDEKHKKLHDLRLYLVDNLDEFHFSTIIRLAICLELSLKGIAVQKKINIFDLRGKHPSTIEVNHKLRSFPFIHFINNSFSILSSEDQVKYSPMFQFFRNKRNQFVHLAKNSYQINNGDLIENLKLAKEFFNRIILPLKQQAARHASNTNNQSTNGKD